MGSKIMRDDILEALQKEVYDRCLKETNQFGMGCYYHIEELCVADADAISHFDNVPALLYLAFVEKGLDLGEGKEFVKNKLMRSYRKLSEDSKRYYRSKFNKVMEFLN